MPDIVTLTINPSIDIFVNVGHVEPTRKMRCSAPKRDPGGGGINVSRVIQALGGETLALVLAGGATGHLIAELLQDANVPIHILPVAGRTRISLTVHDQTANQEYRFVSEGPEISPEELNAAFAAVAATEGGWLVASGSLPRGVPVDTYASLAATAATHGMRYVLDTSGPALTAAMGRGLALIKPSLSELEHLVGRPLPTAAEQDAEAAKLVATGAAEMVAVSLGAEGALLATREGVTRLPALKGQVRSAVGAGDAFLASMVLALSRGSTPADALAWGIAAGAAAVEGVGTARVTQATVEACYRRMHT